MCLNPWAHNLPEKNWLRTQRGLVHHFALELGCSAAGNELAKGAIPPLCTGAGNVLANFTACLGCSGVRKELAEGACPPLGTVT